MSVRHDESKDFVHCSFVSEKKIVGARVGRWREGNTRSPRVGVGIPEERGRPRYG